MPAIGTNPGQLKRAWTSNGNQIVSDAGTANAVAQYQNGVFAFHTAWKAAGWSVLNSAGGNNGGGHVAGAGDNVIIPTDVTIGTEGAENTTWIEYQMKPGFMLGGTLYALIVVNNPSADATPDVLQIYLSIDTQFAGGTATTRPTSADEYLHVNSTFQPQAAAAKVNSHAHSAFNDRGGFWFGYSEDATNHCETFFWIDVADDTETVQNGGPDFANYAVFSAYSRSINGGPSILWGFGVGNRDTTQCATIAGDFSVSRTACAIVGQANAGSGIDMNAFTGGTDGISGNHPAIPIHFLQNAVNGRDLGELVDIRQVPGATPNNTLDDSDPSPTTRYVAVDGILLLVQNAQLPLIL